LEIGSLSEAVSALATVGALVAASIAGRAALQTNRQQSKQILLQEQAEIDRQSDRRQSQASRIASVVVLEQRDDRPSIAWINGSGVPVYDVTCFVIVADRMIAINYRTSVGGSKRRKLGRVTEKLHEEFTFTRAEWRALLSSGRLMTAIKFRDANNVWWCRGFDGTLTEHPNNNAATTQVADLYHEYCATGNAE
jgi:hypothetical protein